MRNAHFLRHADRLNPAMEDKVKEYLAWRKKHNISGYDLYEMLWRAVKRPRKEEFKITDEWVKENFDNKIVENAKPEAIAGYMVLTCQDLIDKRIATLKGEGK